MYACCNLYVHQIFGTFMYVDTNSSVRMADSVRELRTAVREWECC